MRKSNYFEDHIRLLAAAVGCVMVRRLNYWPFVLSTMQWQMMRLTTAMPEPVSPVPEEGSGPLPHQ